jgi:hypothetical protein
VDEDVTVVNTSKNFDAVQWTVDGRDVDRSAERFTISFKAPGPHRIGLRVSNEGVSDEAPEQTITVRAPKPPEVVTTIRSTSVSEADTPAICKAAGVKNGVAVQKNPTRVREDPRANDLTCLREGSEVTLTCKKEGDALFDNTHAPEPVWYKDKETGGYVNALWVNDRDNLPLPEC